MTDYYFISSPLHFCLAANIALQNRAHKSVALIMSRDETASGRYLSAIEKHPDVFASAISLTHSQKGTLARKEMTGLLQDCFSSPEQKRIFTGNDRRYEFQYAMHIATQSGAQIQGIYLDDGAVTYVGHKSMNSIQHRYVDPLLKKLQRGMWWKNSLTTGTSGWIDSAYVAFPDAVHPLLREKNLLPIDPSVFKTDSYKTLISELVNDSALMRESLADVRVVVTLPHEAGFLEKQDVYAQIGEVLNNACSDGEIAIKPHPRTRDLTLLEKCFPGALLLDRRTGMEFLLPLLRDDCLVIGDISTALLTSKWLRPELEVTALRVFGDPPAALMGLYEKLQVELIAPEHLSARLRL